MKISYSLLSFRRIIKNGNNPGLCIPYIYERCSLDNIIIIPYVELWATTQQQHKLKENHKNTPTHTRTFYHVIYTVQARTKPDSTV